MKMQLLAKAIQSDSSCMSGIHPNYLVVSVNSPKLPVARAMQSEGLLRTSGIVNEEGLQVFYVTEKGIAYYESESRN